MPTLFEKSGAEGQYRRFKFEIAKIAERNELPGYTLTLEQPADKREPLLRMRKRAGEAARTTVVRAPPAPAPASTPAPSPERTEELVDAAALIRRSVRGLASRATDGEITPQTLSLLRAECPGWDYQTLHAEFRAWIDGDATRTPVNYQAAFIGYVRRWDAQHRHELGR